MQVKIEVNQDDIKKLIAKAGAIGAVDTMQRALFAGGLYLQAWIQKNRLSGPRPTVLGVKTGRLRSSIAVFNFKSDRNQHLIRIGTNVEYAPIHEFGGVIHRFARSETFLRKRFVKGTKAGKFKKGTAGFGQGFTFGAYSINIPARPFLRPAVENSENLDKVKSIVVNKITDAVEKA